MFRSSAAAAAPASATAPAPAPAARPRRPARVSLLLREPVDRHSRGINAACVAPDGSALYTAGRDGLVFKWLLAGKNAEFSRRLDDHTSWVNDVAVVSDSVALSCSSDTTIKIWRTSKARCLTTLHKHTDYVRCLAYAPGASHFASAGFDGMIYNWDIEACAAVSAPAPAPLAESRGHKDSVYSLATNGSLVVSGSTDKTVRLWDARTGQKQLKFKGHKDNVRAVLINADGTLCVSGSSDRTIRVWDVGQQRCVQTFSVHTDSVWALAADPTFARLFSGSRDGNVFVADLQSRTAAHLCTERNPVLRLAPLPDYKSMWICTPSSDMHLWSLDPPELEDAWVSTAAYSSSPAMGGIAQLQKHQQQRGNAEPGASDGAPVLTGCLSTLHGIPGITRHAILPNRRHILTEDSGNHVALWDVLSGERIKDFGNAVDFAAKTQELSPMLNVPNWFTVDSRLGSLMIHLDTPTCFNAEIYCADLDLPATGDDLKVNLGHWLLQGLFRGWVDGKGGGPKGEQAGEEDEEDDDDEAGDRDGEGEGDKKQPETGSKDGDKGKGKDKAKDEDNEKEPPKAPKHTALATVGESAIAPPTLPGQTVLVVSRGDETLYRAPLHSWDGLEPEGVVPDWVSDALLHDEFCGREAQKLSFLLTPVDDTVLEPLDNARLSAHRVLKLRRVCGYIVGKLQIALPIVDGKEVPAEKYLELFCNGKLVAPDLNLGTAKQFLWKSSDELVFKYRPADEFQKDKAAKGEPAAKTMA